MKEEVGRIKPRVVVSRCIEHAACRYNGQMVNDKLVAKLKDYVDFVAVCPEADIGLGIPREPIRIVTLGPQTLLFQPSTGKEYSKEMNSYTEKFLSNISDVDGFILKYRSPSCGPNDVKVYFGKSSPAEIKGVGVGSGFFGGAALKKFPGLAIEDEARLGNPAIKEHFLTKLFALAAYREAEKKRSTKALTDYHAKNKLILMAYNQTNMRELGKIAGGSGKNIDEVLALYRTGLYESFSKMPKYTSIINVLEHAYGFFKNTLSSEEKKFFQNSVEEYRDERIPLSALQHLLYSWAIRFEEKYLLDQTFFNPFPQELVGITDSGRVRDYEPLKWKT